MSDCNLNISKPSISDGLLSFLYTYSSYIIVGHKEPDGDCICSCLAMSEFLHRHGKKTILLNAGPFKRPEISEFESLFLSELPNDLDKNSTGLIVLDCSGIDRVGDLEKDLVEFDTVIIDHHATNQSVNDNSLVMKTSPSTTYLVQSIIEKVDGKITESEAKYLFFGLSTDTGFFRHLDSRSANVFRHAARLVESGANPKQTFAKMNGGKSFGSRILIAKILSRLTPYYDGRLMISYETKEDTDEYGLEGRDSDAVYQLIQGIRNVEAIVIVRQESDTHCSVGFRSFDKIDVSIIAKSFGGGGHKQASGLYIEGKIKDLIPQFVDAFSGQIQSLFGKSVKA